MNKNTMDSLRFISRIMSFPLSHPLRVKVKSEFISFKTTFSECDLQMGAEKGNATSL